MIGRATKFRYEPGVVLQTASAEDLIVLKAFAGRPRDWLDIESVLIRKQGKLDRRLIFDELRSLCENLESNEPLEKLRELMENVDGRD